MSNAVAAAVAESMPLARMIAESTGDARLAARVGALWGAFWRKNEAAVRADPAAAMTAFLVFCDNADRSAA